MAQNVLERRLEAVESIINLVKNDEVDTHDCQWHEGYAHVTRVFSLLFLREIMIHAEDSSWCATSVLTHRLPLV